MSGELQTIPARHGVATFVPRGRTIKIINTYGKQVVSAWAIGLHAPPDRNDDEEQEDEEIGEEEIEQKAKELQNEVDGGEDQVKEHEVERLKEDTRKAEEGKQESENVTKETETTKASRESEEDIDDPPEQAPETPRNEKTTESTDSMKQPEKRTWSSYLPSIPYRNRGNASNNKQQAKSDSKDEKARNEEASKKWSSYLPTGKGFSSYVPNMQIPDSKEFVSAFKSSHYRDPNKSYAEQLYDFSKTPVGAGSLAAATGSGTASSLYAAYNAYTKLNPAKNDQPPMEYLSLPHTRASTHRLVPEVDDTLLTNLRNPIMTLVEDTTPGAHDTLTAACDASLYAALGVDKPAEHGSCAENLVLALKELNGKAGLKGTKAVGADISVNIAPTPLHLFMNAPLEVGSSTQTECAGAKGATLKVEEPKGKKRSYVRFRAERDMVVVLSACPMDLGPQNGGRCMAANFMVEEPEEDLDASTSSLNKKKAIPSKSVSSSTTSKMKEQESKPVPKPRGGPQKATAVQKSAAQARRDSAAADPPESQLPEKKKIEEKEESKTEKTPKPKKKPKKLERRGGSAPPAKADSS